MKWRRNRTTGRAEDGPSLDARRIAWLMAVAACGLLPHASHLPGWLDAVATLLFTWRVAQLRLRWPGAAGNDDQQLHRSADAGPAQPQL